MVLTLVFFPERPVLSLFYRTSGSPLAGHRPLPFLEESGMVLRFPQRFSFWFPARSPFFGASDAFLSACASGCAVFARPCSSLTIYISLPFFRCLPIRFLNLPCPTEGRDFFFFFLSHRRASPRPRSLLRRSDTPWRRAASPHSDSRHRHRFRRLFFFRDCTFLLYDPALSPDVPWLYISSRCLPHCHMAQQDPRIPPRVLYLSGDRFIFIAHALRSPFLKGTPFYELPSSGALSTAPVTL